MAKGTLPCAMTVDVEDYFHVAAFKQVISPQDWNQWPSRVENNTQRLLELFEQHSISATFFVLGWVADRYPALVKEISRRGHEIASHGFSHQLIFEQNPRVFREESYRSKALLEDLSGAPVTGYRAASYSITRKSLWALDILAELGFTWDSSIFPIHHDTYGMLESPRHPYRLVTPSGATLTEFPLSTARFGGLSVPAAGGGYFRQYPYWLSRYLLKKAGADDDSHNTQARIFYLHPWEIDPEQPRVKGAGWKSNFRHYRNLQHCLSRLERLCEDFSFTTVKEILESTSTDRCFDLRNELHGIDCDYSEDTIPSGPNQATQRFDAPTKPLPVARAHQANQS